MLSFTPTSFNKSSPSTYTDTPRFPDFHEQPSERILPATASLKDLTFYDPLKLRVQPLYKCLQRCDVGQTPS